MPYLSSKMSVTPARRRRRRPASAFTMIEVMIVMVIIGVLLNMAMPGLIRARESSRASSCIRNLRGIQGAKELYAMDNRIAANAPAPAWSNLVSASGSGASPVASGYLRSIPTCPATGRSTSYTLGRIGENPICEIAGNRRPSTYDDHILR